MTKTKDIEIEVSAGELANWLGIGTQSVAGYARTDVVVRAATRGKFFLRESVRGYIAHMAKVAVERENPTTTERLRLLRAEATSIENKLKALRDRLISVSKAARDWRHIQITVRAKVLELPERVSKRLPPGRLAPHDLAAIRREALLCLVPLADEPEDAPANA
jgi:phage terminase Nu1 subunit (DNA packaging protein)